MGVVDIKIDVMRECQWRKWRRTVASNNAQQKQSGESNSDDKVNSDQHMDHELYWAAAKASPDGFMLIVENMRAARGQNVSQKDVLLCVSPNGNTVLHVAAIHGNLSTMKRIASLPESLISSRNCNGDTPLHLAAEAGHVDFVKELISIIRDCNGASDDKMTREKNEQGNTALHMALISSNEAVAWSLVQVDPEAMFCLNEEDKSGLYLAAEAGYADVIKHTLKACEEEDNQLYEKIKGKPPVHAAILGRQMRTLRILVEQEQRLVRSRDKEGRTALHHAAIAGCLDGVKYILIKHSGATGIKDNCGFFPIHLAAMEGRVDVVDILLRHSIDPVELRDNKCRNVLHVAAEYGKTIVVNYILKNPDCRKLINAKDQDGNTPLHLATVNWHPRIVSALTWSKNLDLSLTNNNGLTALDAAEFYIDGQTSFHQRLTWTALTAAGAKRAPPTCNQNLPCQFIERSKPMASINNYKDRVNTLLVVATLIATITFAAGFTVPGGYSNSGDLHQGQATMLRRKIFSLFIFCDTIAMYSAMIVTISMIWAQLGDLNLVLIALRLGMRLIGVSLTMMSIAFMAGIYAVVSDLHWLCHAVIIMGMVFFVTLSALSFPLCFPISSNTRVLRYMSYYPFLLLMYITKSGISNNWEDKYNCK